MNISAYSYENNSKLRGHGEIIAHIDWLPDGYRYWTNRLTPQGWRHIGIEALGVMDDFGHLVFVDQWKSGQ